MTSLAAVAALFSSILVAGTASADAPAYATTVTVYCDGHLVQISGNFYKNYGAPNAKLLYLNDDKMFVAWGGPDLACPGDGTTPTLTATWTTKFAPTDAVVYWDNRTTCASSAAFAVPVDATNPNCGLDFSVRVVIPPASRV
jgi:hypothetical protein